MSPPCRASVWSFLDREIEMMGRFGLIGATALATGILLGAPAPAKAQEGSWLGPLFMNMLGGGSKDDGITYRDRAPLVVPPRSTLPSPQQERSRDSANWPRDPDVERRRRAEQESLIPSFLTGAEPMMGDRGVRRLSNDELARGRISPGQQPTGPLGTPAPLLEDRMGSNTDVIRQMRSVDAARAAARAEEPVGAEPPRRFLTDPPTGLRGATQRVRATAEPARDEQALGIRDFQRQQQRN